LYCCGPVPPLIEAVNVTATPLGEGVGRDAAMPSSLRLPPDVVDPDEEIANGMLLLAPALSYASAVLPPLRTHTPTRYPVPVAVGVHVHVLLDDHSRLMTQFAPS
jgi:hypothetical protein